MTQVKARSIDSGRVARAYLTKRHIINYLLIFSLLCFLGMLVMRFITVYSLNFDLVGVETNVVYSVQSLIAGQPLYNDPMYLPFTITQYTPLYYCICAYTAELLNVDPSTDIHNIYVIGRMWNVFFNFLSAYAIFLMCRNIFRLNGIASLVAALTAFIFTFRHDFSVRPDSLQNLLVLWGIYTFFVYLKNKQNSRSLVYLAVAVFLGVSSIFAKQSGIQVSIIFILFLLFTQNWRGFIAGSVFTALFFGGYLLYFHQLYGEAFLQNVIGGVANGVTLRGFLMWVVGAKPFILKIFIPFLIVSYIIIKANLLFKGTAEEKFLAFCLVGLFGFATVTGFKQGATAQYYGLFQYMAWVLIFYYFLKYKDFYNKRAADVRPYSFNRLGIWVYLAGLLAINTLYQAWMIRTDEFKGRAHLLSERQKTQNVATYLKEDLSLAPGEKVFANLSVDDRRGINNALFEHAVVPQLEIVHFSTSPLKVFGYDNFDDNLRNGNIKYIIDSNPVYDFSVTKNFEQLKKSNYSLVKTIDNYSIYQYNK